MRLLDIDNYESYLGDTEVVGSSAPDIEDMPETIALLPIRNAVAFPGTIMPLAIGRKGSKTLLKDLKEDELVGLITQKNPEIDEPGPDDIYQVGTVASVLKVIQMPTDTLTVAVQAHMRFRIVEITQHEPYMRARISAMPVKLKTTKKFKALVVTVKQQAARVLELSPNVPEEANIILENIANPDTLVDFVAGTINAKVSDKQQFLEEVDVQKRLQKVSLELAKQLEVLELSQKIQGDVRSSIDKSQREYFLQEQLKAIQTELGQTDMKTEELNQLKEKINSSGMPAKVRKEAMRELERLSKIPQISPEYSVARSYIDWICELPWSNSTQDSLDIPRAEKILEADHYGLKKVKKRILEFLAVRKLNPEGKSPILCFAGPPGVGKTSLGKSIARAMGRKFVRISLGGIRDEADIRGHRRTYIGSMPGRILQELRKCDSSNPVFMLDELDKIGQDFRGDPASALLEVLDPEQNNTFTDHYIDQPFDLSKVLFIGTANYIEDIPDPLYDRMEVINITGYTANEKLKIAKKYLVPRQLKENGLKKSQITFKDDALMLIINSYTRESGVRSLERQIAAVCRSLATNIARGTKRRATITKAAVKKILGLEKFTLELANRIGVPGVVAGLAWTPTGGDLLFVEALGTPGKGDLSLTGQLGEIMKESAQAAFTLVKSIAPSYSIDEAAFKEFDYHIHVPAGAVPKDGPSAGITMFTALFSLVMGVKVRPDFAMTGEISLQGTVLPIGGLKEKVLAAKQAGIKTVILPRRNKNDMADVSDEIKKGMEFIYIKRAEEVIKHVLDE
ncbi:Lon protease 2 [Limihaloglobus sulfuriphilus]|uniref:Lon protease n=1 Tax=Limihaloglobus sulfuriphilus TaxID=1851148 RepID=A0A1Q2MBD1_9BACT|nr:endopeptidase La [Limihaloglobus sulfuriphilus]AQQ70035.1 Lon protease 2 [Limihaloglobus sulfuriphilus]